MSDAEVAIVAMDARHACKDEPDLVLRIKKAMKGARNNWITRNPDLMLRGALYAATQETPVGTPEYERLDRSIRALAKASAALNAMIAGVPVNLEEMAITPDEEQLPLLKYWLESGEENSVA